MVLGFRVVQRRACRLKGLRLRDELGLRGLA